MTYEARSDMIVLELQLHFVGSKVRFGALISSFI